MSELTVEPEPPGAGLTTLIELTIIAQDPATCPVPQQHSPSLLIEVGGL
jgi:hypothetical protein